MRSTKRWKIRRKIAGRWMILSGLTALAACGDSSTGPQPVDIRDVEFAPELGVDLDAMTMTQTGLYYEDVEVGDGVQAAIGSTVFVRYTGWLSDGTQFDSNVGLPDPLELIIGGGMAIAGFQEGIVGMRVGGIRLLAVPWELAFGAQGQGDGVIPPYANLVFRIELVEVLEEG